MTLEIALSETDLAAQAQADARAGRPDLAEAVWREILKANPGCQTAAVGLVKVLDGRGERA